MTLRSEVLVVVALLLGTAGCSPTLSQITSMRAWSANARKSCTTPGSCPEPETCIRAVVRATESGAGRAEYKAAETSCWSYAGGDR